MPSSEQRATPRDGTASRYTLYDHPAARQRVVLVHSLAMDRSFWRPGRRAAGDERIAC